MIAKMVGCSRIGYIVFGGGTYMQTLFYFICCASKLPSISFTFVVGSLDLAFVGFVDHKNITAAHSVVKSRFHFVSCGRESARAACVIDVVV